MIKRMKTMGIALAAALLGMVGLAGTTNAQAKTKTQTVPKSLQGYWGYDFGDADVSVHITPTQFKYAFSTLKLSKKLSNKTFTLSKKANKKGYWTIKTGTKQTRQVYQYKRVKKHIHVIIVKGAAFGKKSFNYQKMDKPQIAALNGNRISYVEKWQ